MVIGSASKPCAIALRLPLPLVHRRPGLLSDGRMPDYYARLIPHLKGPHRVLALRKQHLGLYDGLFVREAGKFLSGYNMAASKEIAPHAMLPIWSPGDGGPFGALVTLRNILRGCQRCARAGRYRLDGLVQRFGADAALPDDLMKLALMRRPIGLLSAMRGAVRGPCFAPPRNETPPSEIGLSEILRHKAEPETGKRRVKNLKDTVEDELAFNPRSQFAAVLLELAEGSRSAFDRLPLKTTRFRTKRDRRFRSPRQSNLHLWPSRPPGSDDRLPEEAHQETQPQ